MGALWDRYSSEAIMRLWEPAMRVDFIARALRGELRKEEYNWVLESERRDQRIREWERTLNPR